MWDGSQPAVTSAPGNLTPFLASTGTSMYVYIYTERHNTERGGEEKEGVCVCLKERERWYRRVFLLALLSLGE